MSKLKITAGLVFSAVILFFSFRGLDWSRFKDVFLGFPASLIALVVMINLAAAFIRAWRWTFLLKAVGDVRFVHSFNYTNIGYFVNSILPGRVGEIVRPILLAQKTGKSKIAVLTTVLVERLFDFLGILGLLLTASLVADLPAWMKKGGGAVIAGAFLVLALLFIVSRDFRRVERLVLFASFGREKIRNFLDPKMRSFFTALGILRSSRNTIVVFGQTLLVWAFYLLATRIMISTLGLGDRRWPAAVIVLLFLSLSMVIPSSPGYLGTYQLATIASLALFGISKTEAVATSFLLQLPVFFLNISLGLFSVWWEGLGLDLVRRTRRPSLRINSDEANPALFNEECPGCEASEKAQR